MIDKSNLFLFTSFHELFNLRPVVVTPCVAILIQQDLPDILLYSDPFHSNEVQGECRPKYPIRYFTYTLVSESRIPKSVNLDFLRSSIYKEIKTSH